MTLNLKGLAMLLTVPALLFAVTSLEGELIQIRGGEFLGGATQIAVKLQGNANETISRLSSLVEEAAMTTMARANSELIILAKEKPQARLQPEPQATSTTSSNHEHQKHASSSSSHKNPIMDYFNLCRIQPEPVEGGPRIKMPGLPIPLTFQCAGQAYHDVSDILEQVIFNRAQEDLTGQWGRQRTLVPLDNNDNNNKINKERAILIMGNSHTRQLVATLLCQYRHQIINTTDLYPLDGP